MPIGATRLLILKVKEEGSQEGGLTLFVAEPRLLRQAGDRGTDVEESDLVVVLSQSRVKRSVSACRAIVEGDCARLAIILNVIAHARLMVCGVSQE